MPINARATRIGGWWAVEAEHAKQAIFTQARRFDQVDQMVRGAFEAVGLDVSDETVSVTKMPLAPALLIEEPVDDTSGFRAPGDAMKAKSPSPRKDDWSPARA